MVVRRVIAARPARDRDAERLRESAQRLLTQARRGGVPYDDVVDLIDEIWKEMGS